MASMTLSEFYKQAGELADGHVFRGLRKTDKLETTLERTTEKKYSLQSYMRLLQQCVPEVEAHSGRCWDQVGKDVPRTFHTLGDNQMLVDFMIYMRHHGFPSPIMDWTRSPYIAAYFAFSNASPEEPVKIIAYSTNNYPHAQWAGTPQVKLLDPLVTADKRHHTQQASYTVCLRSEANGDELCRHEAADKKLFREFHIEADRRAALKMLDRMNINAYTLFHDEDGLAKSLGEKRFS